MLSMGCIKTNNRPVCRSGQRIHPSFVRTKRIPDSLLVWLVKKEKWTNSERPDETDQTLNGFYQCRFSEKLRESAKKSDLSVIHKEGCK
jgi:hypothetical protein